MKKLLLGSVLSALVLFTACEKIDLAVDEELDKNKDNVICTEIAVPGIVINTYDAKGKPMEIVYGKVVNMKTKKVEEVKGKGSISAAYEAPGLYNVYLEAKGYHPVELKDIVVKKEDICHVKTVRLKAVFKLMTDKKEEIKKK